MANFRPTLIVFAREPIAGRTKTRLIPVLGAQGAAMLAQAFIVDAIAKARRLRPPHLVIAAERPNRRPDGFLARIARRFGAELADQGPGDLGRRMARALEPHVQGRGAILVGTDTPTLPPALLRQSANQLTRCAVTVAPALDGGYYLVGARGAVPDIFLGIKWGGRTVMAQTLARARKLGLNYQLGPWWYDVDRPRDLNLLRSDLAGHFRPAGRVLPAACPATIRALAALPKAFPAPGRAGGGFRGGRMAERRS